jgi:hypothetical protein
VHPPSRHTEVLRCRLRVEWSVVVKRGELLIDGLFNEACQNGLDVQLDRRFEHEGSHLPEIRHG